MDNILYFVSSFAIGCLLITIPRRFSVGDFFVILPLLMVKAGNTLCKYFVYFFYLRVII